MKLLFWSAIILATVWWLMKRSNGGGNDLTAHLKEQEALKSIGDSALGANQISSQNWPLVTIGDTSLAGVPQDPLALAYNSPFSDLKNPDFLQSTPAAPGGKDFSWFLN